MPTIHELATELSRSFEEGTRPDGETFRRLKDDAPGWTKDVVREAHGRDSDGTPAMLPDDWRYQFAEDAADAISEADDDADLDDVANDLEADVYTSELTGWLHSRNDRVSYLDDARENNGAALDAFQLLAAAQQIERREVFQLVREQLAQLANDDEH